MNYDPKDAADFIVALILFILIVGVLWMAIAGYI
jgi:hypothetical protein